MKRLSRDEAFLVAVTSPSCRTASLTGNQGLDGIAALAFDELNRKAPDEVPDNSSHNASNRKNRSDIGHRVGRYRGAGNGKIENEAGLHAAIR